MSTNRNDHAAARALARQQMNDEDQKAKDAARSSRNATNTNQTEEKLVVPTTNFGSRGAGGGHHLSRSVQPQRNHHHPGTRSRSPTYKRSLTDDNGTSSRSRYNNTDNSYGNGLEADGLFDDSFRTTADASVVSAVSNYSNYSSGAPVSPGGGATMMTSLGRATTAGTVSTMGSATSAAPGLKRGVTGGGGGGGGRRGLAGKRGFSPKRGDTSAGTKPTITTTVHARATTTADVGVHRRVPSSGDGAGIQQHNNNMRHRRVRSGDGTSTLPIAKPKPNNNNMRVKSAGMAGAAAGGGLLDDSSSEEELGDTLHQHMNLMSSNTANNPSPPPVGLNHNNNPTNNFGPGRHSPTKIYSNNNNDDDNDDNVRRFSGVEMTEPAVRATTTSTFGTTTSDNNYGRTSGFADASSITFSPSLDGSGSGRKGDDPGMTKPFESRTTSKDSVAKMSAKLAPGTAMTRLEPINTTGGGLRGSSRSNNNTSPLFVGSRGGGGRRSPVSGIHPPEPTGRAVSVGAYSVDGSTTGGSVRSSNNNHHNNNSELRAKGLARPPPAAAMTRLEPAQSTGSRRTYATPTTYSRGVSTASSIATDSIPESTASVMSSSAKSMIAADDASNMTGADRNEMRRLKFGLSNNMATRPGAVVTPVGPPPPGAAYSSSTSLRSQQENGKIRNSSTRTTSSTNNKEGYYPPGAMGSNGQNASQRVLDTSDRSYDDDDNYPGFVVDGGGVMDRSDLENAKMTNGMDHSHNSHTNHSSNGGAASPPPPQQQQEVREPGAYRVLLQQQQQQESQQNFLREQQAQRRQASDAMVLADPAPVIYDHPPTLEEGTGAPVFFPGADHPSTQFQIDDETGTVSKDDASKISRGTKLFLVFGCIALVVGIVVAVVVTGGGGGDGGASTVDSEADDSLNPGTETLAPSRLPGTDIEDYVWSLLPETTTQAIIQDVNGSQAIAIDWLLQDPSVEEYTNPRLLQRFSLVTLYHEAGGAQWEDQGNWLSYDHHECSWMTVKACKDADKENNEYTMDARIIFVKLAETNVHGNLPPQIGLLSDLEVLTLKTNKVNGVIPSQIGLLTGLKELSLGSNQLGGPIPDEIGRLTNLQRLYLEDNKLTGSLPPSIVNLVQLNDVLLSHNQLSNSIPTTIGQLTKLKRMQLDNNTFTGEIPSQFGNLVNMVSFWLGSNRLVGSIPKELSQMSNKLRSLALNANFLTGKIPTFLSTFDSLTELDLSNNTFSDAVPYELPPNVKVLNIGRSGVRGTLPTQLGLLTKLTELKTFKNDGFAGGNITGPIPSELGLLTDMNRIEMDFNRLTGTIPTQLFAMTKLEILSLYLNTFLTGPIPSEIGLCTNLQILEVDRNNLSGPLPTTELANLDNLGHLNISNNPALTGTIPSTFCDERRLITRESFQCGPVCGCNFCPCSA